MSALADPAVLSIIFAAIGAAFTWLWTQVAKANRKHRDCEVKIAELTVLLDQQRREVGVIQGTCNTLTQLLKKEAHFGT